MHFVRTLTVILIAGVVVGGVLLCKKLHVSNYVSALTVKAAMQDIYLDIKMDPKGRLLSVVPYYRDPMGRKIIHGDVIEIDWEGHTKTIDHYRHGEVYSFESRSLMPDGSEIGSE